VANVVETILKLQGSRQFQKEADASAKSVKGIGDASEQSGKKAGIGWKGMAKWAGGTAAVYGAARFLKGAVSSTENLAKATMTLQRATGLDARTASSWAEILKVRGIDTNRFQVGMVKLSKTMEAARAGNKKAIATFAALGVSQDAIATGNVNDVLMQSADAFAAMDNPAQKAATAATLFGKSGQALIPIMSGGSKGIEDQIAMVQKYGATIGSTDEAKQMIARQREMAFAMDGLKIQLGTKLMPAFQAFSGVILTVVQALSPLLKNTTALSLVLGLLTTAYVTLKVATIASTIAQFTFNAALLLIPLAIVAIVAGVVLMYTKWKWFHNAVNNTFAWVKSHWPLLLAILVGPFGLAVLAIVKNFDAIKSAVGAAIHWIADRFRDIAKFFDQLHIGKIVSAVGSVAGKLPGLATGGTVISGGAAVVGERGPEIVTLARGATVWPTPAVEALAGRPPLDTRGGPTQTVVTKVYLDRRQIAEAVGTYASDKQARR
jgi:predicted membrane protein